MEPTTPAAPPGTKFKQAKIPVHLLPPEAVLELFAYNDDLQDSRLGEALQYLFLWYSRSDTSGEACNALEAAATLLMADIADELSCEPLGAWLEVARVLEFGAHLKPRPDGTPGPNGNGHGYGERNWEKGIPYTDVWSASVRHILKRLRGEMYDDETKFYHPVHALCDVMFLMTYEARGMGDRFDDRPRIESGQVGIQFYIPKHIDSVSACEIADHMHEEFRKILDRAEAYLVVPAA